MLRQIRPFRRLSLAAAALLSVALSVPAFAEGAGGPLRQACAEDVQKLCHGVQPGGGRIKACMREHASNISEACKAAIAARHHEKQSGDRAKPQDWPKLVTRTDNIALPVG